MFVSCFCNWFLQPWEAFVVCAFCRKEECGNSEEFSELLFLKILKSVLKITDVNWAWWYTHGISVTQEAEAGSS
jgi:hypothetical protein